MIYHTFLSDGILKGSKEAPPEKPWKNSEVDTCNCNSCKQSRESYKILIEKWKDSAIVFEDQDRIGVILTKMFSGYISGQVYSVELEVIEVELCGCYNLKGPSEECRNAGGKNPYACVSKKLILRFPLEEKETDWAYCDVCKGTGKVERLGESQEEQLVNLRDLKELLGKYSEDAILKNFTIKRREH